MNSVRASWEALASGAADAWDGATVEIAGLLCPAGEAGPAITYGALVAEPPCCPGCLPGDPAARVEVFAARPVAAAGAAPVRLRGTWRVLAADAAGWRYQLRDASALDGPGAAASPFTRRSLLAAGSLACLSVAAPLAACAQPGAEQVQAALAGAPTADIHSHAGHITRVTGDRPIDPVAAPMRAGGMAVVCLAIVSDGPTHKVMPDGRLHPFRDPTPGELYNYAQASFARVHALARTQDMPIITDAAALAAARPERPSIVVSAEGGDFLEGQPDRVDEAYTRWGLRHLQLTHYRVNELGDIQTEAPVHGGLTDAGADVIRRCNRLGVVVDVAHGTFDLVKRAVSVTTRPIVLSHTSLAAHPGLRSRLISPDHARAVAGTGGIVGIWPPASLFPDMPALAGGIARMVDVIGVEHVALGSDMNGLVGTSVFPTYRALPDLAATLLARGFSPGEVRLLLGDNYRRVFAASMA